jgi:uncharacterized membrane protein YdbT with pleckstrin-like domain
MENIQQQFYYPLGRKTFWIFIMQGTGPAFLFFIPAIIIIALRELLTSNNLVIELGLIMNLAVAISFILGILIFVFGIIIGLLQYNVSKVMLDNASFHIVRGALSKEEVMIPYRRIQSVEIKQSLFYRIMGVGHVVISTTTDLEGPGQVESESDEEVIPTIDYSLAKIVEKTLTDRAEIERVENIHS